MRLHRIHHGFELIRRDASTCIFLQNAFGLIGQHTVHLVIDLLHLQGLPLMLASTCCKAIFRSSFAPSRRDLACCQRIPMLIFYRRDLENDGTVQMKCEKPLCCGWMHISTATPVNAKGLIGAKPHARNGRQCAPFDFHGSQSMRNFERFLNSGSHLSRSR